VLPQVVVLIAVCVLGKAFGVWVLVGAAFVGPIVQIPLMFYYLHRCGVRYRPVMHLRGEVIRSAILDAIPIAIGVIVVTLAGMLLQRTASYGEEGTVACFNYSLLLLTALNRLVCQPVVVSMSPRITRYLEAGNYEASKDLLGRSIGLVVLICLSCTAVVWYEAPLIVDFMFGHGRFTAEAVHQTSAFLAIMFVGAMGTGFQWLGMRVLLARRRSMLVMTGFIAAGLVRALLGGGGRHWWGVYASGIAQAGGSWANGLVCMTAAIWIVGLYGRMGNVGTIIRWMMACAIVAVVPILPHMINPVGPAAGLLARVVHLSIVSVATGLSVAFSGWLIRLYTVERVLSAGNQALHMLPFRCRSGKSG